MAAKAEALATTSRAVPKPTPGTYDSARVSSGTRGKNRSELCPAPA